MLRGGEDRSVSPDLFLDLFYQFMLWKNPGLKNNPEKEPVLDEEMAYRTRSLGHRNKRS
jgi:hypothetical protein